MDSASRSTSFSGLNGIVTNSGGDVTLTTSQNGTTTFSGTLQDAQASCRSRSAVRERLY